MGKTKTELNAQVDSTIYTNVVGGITASAHNTLEKDIIDSSMNELGPKTQADLDLQNNNIVNTNEINGKNHNDLIAEVTINNDKKSQHEDTSTLIEGTNLYYTDARVSANPDVANNTSKVSASGSIDTHSDVDISTTGPADGQVLVWRTDEFVPEDQSGGGGGSGDVVGPASSTDDNLAAFDGTTGKLIKDSGEKIADFVKGPASSRITNVVVFEDGTGKKIFDSGVSLNDVPEISTDDVLPIKMKLAVVDALPATPDSETIYFIRA
jgi:hypothetical protein